MPFKRPGKETWYGWVTACSGERRQLSLGTKLEREAKKIERWCDDIRERGDKQGVLAAIVAGDVKLLEAYAAGPDAPALVVRKAAERQNPDLAVHLDAWERDDTRDGIKNTYRVRRMVDMLFAYGPIRPADLTPVALRGRIMALPDISTTTRNHYAAALSSFVRWCVRQGHMPRNPVRDMERWTPNASPMRLWTPEQAEEIITAIEEPPYRVLCALMAGAGWEFAACANAFVRDITPDGVPPTAFARGTKNAWRERLCVITERWTLPLIRDYLAGMDPSAKLLPPSVTVDKAVKRMQAVLDAQGKPHATNHDWRHSYAVWLLQRGELPTTIAHQLGHKDTQLLWTRYGRYVTTLRHYRTVSTIEEGTAHV